MSGGTLFPTVVQASQLKQLGEHRLELWVYDPEKVLRLPENPQKEQLAKRPELMRCVKDVHECVLIDEANARLSVRVWDPSRCIVYLCATGEAVKLLKAAFHHSDKRLLENLDGMFAEDDQKPNAEACGHLSVNHITEMPRTFTELLRLIRNADPAMAWQPLRVAAQPEAS